MPANFLLRIPPQKRKLAFFLHCFFFYRYTYLYKYNASDVSSFFFKILSIFGFQGTNNTSILTVLSVMKNKKLFYLSSLVKPVI